MASIDDRQDTATTTEDGNTQQAAKKGSRSKRSGRAQKKSANENGQPQTSAGNQPSAVEAVAAALAGGDLAADMLAEGDTAETDESTEKALRQLSAMARNMRRTVGRLQRAADSIEDISRRVLEGGRTLSLSVSDEAASVDSTVSSIAEISASARSVAEAVQSLSALAQTTSTSSLEMAASIDEVSANADALTAFVEETASSIEEMAASVRNVASSTESLATATDETERSMRAIDDSTQRVGLAVGETAVLAEEVQRSAEQGSRIVLETAESMRATRRGIEMAAETISALGERSDRIGAITRVIEEIADRTNLLALNARILAAQAGQQGRGFAVVAEEIKELSERTARSTAEIDELIKGVRESVGAAVGQASDNRQLADKGVELAERAATSLTEISQKTSLSASAIRQIAEAAATQSLESHQVTELMGQVRRRAQEIERATSEQAQTSKQIGERALHMAELTEQVRRAMQEQATASKHIALAMEQLTEVVEQIGGAVGEQHRGTEDVLRAIEVIRDAVTRNQASIVQMNYTAGQLDHEAASLRDSVGYFRLPEPQRGGHLSFGVADHVPTFDVLESITVTSSNQLSLILEGLVAAGEGAGVEPMLAESWDISADGRTYTFHLRENVRFHNGRVMTSEDVIYSIRRTLRESAAGRWVFMNLVGAQSFSSGETEELTGARAVDDLTVELELVEPLAFFLPMLCLSFASVVPREEIEGDAGERFKQHPVGTGAFKLESFDAECVELLRFEDYWQANKPYVDGVTVCYEEDGEKLFERFRRGELAFLREDSAERVSRLTADAELRANTIFATQLHTQFLAFDAEQEPFNDVRVRRAVAHAIDRERLVNEAYGGMAVPAAGPIPPGLMGYEPDYKGLEYDPERARKLLREAGHGRGLKVELWRSVPEQSASEAAGRIICEQLGAVGINCDLRVVDIEDLVKAAREGRARLAELRWYADYADPDNFTYMLFHSANRQSRWRTARVLEIEHLSERARTIVNRAERARLYTELQHMIAEQAVCAFLTHRRAAIVHRSDVEGMHVHLVSPTVRPQEIWLSKAVTSDE
jgi:ABC-type transport system substrate-binding protein/methyl-accepting chemotaxis protein